LSWLISIGENMESLTGIRKEVDIVNHEVQCCNSIQILMLILMLNIINYRYQKAKKDNYRSGLLNWKLGGCIFAYVYVPSLRICGGGCTCVHIYVCMCIACVYVCACVHVRVLCVYLCRCECVYSGEAYRRHLIYTQK
jgi:hypothetical protein